MVYVPWASFIGIPYGGRFSAATTKFKHIFGPTGIWLLTLEPPPLGFPMVVDFPLPQKIQISWPTDIWLLTLEPPSLGFPMVVDFPLPQKIQMFCTNLMYLHANYEVSFKYCCFCYVQFSYVVAIRLLLYATGIVHI